MPPRRATTKKVTRKTAKPAPASKQTSLKMKKMASDLKKAATTLMRHSKQLRSTKK